VKFIYFLIDLQCCTVVLLL